MPTGFSIAITAIAALDTGVMPGILTQYGLLGELVRAGGVAALFAVALQVHRKQRY